MNNYHSQVIDFFTEKWFIDHWSLFCETRKKYSKDSFDKEIIKLELSLHPLLREVFRFQINYDTSLDFTRIPQFGSSDYIFSHLGRDLELLKDEISSHGNKIRDDLIDPEKYESTRYCLLVASGYKLLGNRIEFIASNLKQKRPDLLIQGKQNTFLIECKQRNQNISDRGKYDFFSELTKFSLPLLRENRIRNTLLTIELNEKTKIESISNDFFNNVRKTIDETKEITNSEYELSLIDLLPRRTFLELLQDSGHFDKYPVFTKTEDGFIASDPQSKNVVWLNKNIRLDKIPSAVYEELDDANLKEKNGNKMLLYYDFGTGVSDWGAIFSKHIHEHIDEYYKDYPNIDGYVISQVALKYLQKQTVIQPSFNYVGKISALGGTPITLNLFGFQGFTGIDGYILKQFHNPIGPTMGKYIQCPYCGFTLEHISTNLLVGQKLSQVSMPCLRCKQPMDMRIKEA